jgi:hypothetical protein
VGRRGRPQSDSPLLTTWPSCTRMFFSLGTSSSHTLPSGSVICRRTLPLVSLPKEMVPVISASVPLSFGVRASNSSATRGRPPVMSRVFWPSIGIRASTSPGPDVHAVTHLDQRTNREANCHRVVGTRDLHLVAGCIDQLNLRAHHLGQRHGVWDRSPPWWKGR